MSTLPTYTIGDGATIIDAFRKIDINQKGFLIVIDDSVRVLGVLTDGDLRRALIRGANLDDSIHESYTRTFKSISTSDDIADIVESFVNPKLNFLPILKNDGTLNSVITKSAFHSLMVQEQELDLDCDFLAVDEADVFHEYYFRPWGYYKTTIKNSVFQSKILLVRPNQALSLQMHKHREEHWLVTSGTGLVQVGSSTHPAKPGDSFFIPRETLHRLANPSHKDNLLLVEVQLGDYFGEDDIYRFSDDYGRPCCTKELEE